MGVGWEVRGRSGVGCGVWTGNFDIILDPFSRISQPHVVPHRPTCAVRWALLSAHA